MARTQETTPFYIRTERGETFFVETLEEALEEFTGDDGYRLTLTAGSNGLVIRRHGEWSDDNYGGKEGLATLGYRESEVNDG